MIDGLMEETEDKGFPLKNIRHGSKFLTIKLTQGTPSQQAPNPKFMTHPRVTRLVQWYFCEDPQALAAQLRPWKHFV